MIRATLLLLCLMLLAAAAGRYKAEASVSAIRGEINEIREQKRSEESQILLLRAEIAYLENPERLRQIAARVSGLQPVTGSQLMTAEEFRFAFAPVEDGRAPPPIAPSPLPTIAIATLD